MYSQAHWETYAPLFGAGARRLDATELAHRWRAILSTSDPVRVASDGPLLIGVSHAHGEVLDSLYLLKAYHGRGLGRQLMAEVLILLAAGGLREARIEVLAANHTAIEFYRACGARTVGRRLRSGPEGAWENVVLQIPCTDLLESSRPERPPRG